MKTELFISLRYLLTKRKEKFISLISIISVLGVAIGVTALIVVIAVMSGFDKDLRDKIVGNYSHLTIASFRGLGYKEYQDIAKKVSLNPGVTALSPYVQGQLLVKEGSKFFAVSVKGIEPETEPRVTKISRYLIEGALEELKDDTVIVGKELASYLGVDTGSLLEVYSPLGKRQDLTVVGVFNSGMYEYDLNLIFTNLKTAQQVLGLGDQISAIGLRLDNLYHAEKMRKALVTTLGYEYIIKTWMEANQTFFAALKLEKLTMFIILTLIILVASFNIISTLIVMVVEKTKDIGILKAIGMNAKSIKKIFTLEGIIIGGMGTLLGTLGGLTLCLLLKKYRFITLPKDIYYIDKLPVSIELWPDITLVVVAAMLITVISTLYPAGKAAQLKPVEALRYE